MEKKIKLEEIAEGEKLQELIELLPQLKELLSKMNDRTPPTGTTGGMLEDIIPGLRKE